MLAVSVVVVMVVGVVGESGTRINAMNHFMIHAAFIVSRERISRAQRGSAGLRTSHSPQQNLTRRKPSRGNWARRKVMWPARPLPIWQSSNPAATVPAGHTVVSQHINWRIHDPNDKYVNFTYPHAMSCPGRDPLYVARIRPPDLYNIVYNPIWGLIATKNKNKIKIKTQTQTHPS